MIYIANAFSLSMLPQEHSVDLRVVPTTADYVRDRLVVAPYVSASVRSYHASLRGYVRDRLVVAPYVSCVGHAQTAALFTAALGIEVRPNRISVSLSQRDTLFVGQYIGPRLPEGAASLPEGATIRWFQITLREAGVVANPVHMLEVGK